MDTTRTVSSSRAAASKSFNTCWTVPACEIPCSSTVWTKQRPEPVSRDGRHRSGSPLGQPPPGSVRVRSVADSTLRGYAHDLLHFLRWWVGVNQTEAIAEKALTASTLLDYIRFQTNLWRIRGKTASGRICFNDGAAARVALS